MSTSINLKITLLFTALAFFCCCTKTQNEEKIDPNAGTAYLFVHMTDDNYGKMYYDISRKGVTWTSLNRGKQIEPNYTGHPTITKGGDGKYYMIGVEKAVRDCAPVVWSSSDLITWASKKLDRSIFDVSQFGADNHDAWIGAPKVFYDNATDQFLISWHSFQEGLTDNTALWESMRTYYILTSDWETFTPAARLFNFSGKDENMATIDAIIVKEADTYYAVIKDERWPETANTGKTIRIASATSVTGPYGNPGPSVTPAWREAPTVVPNLTEEGYLLFCEEYPYHYCGFKATSMSQTVWKSIDVNFPEGGRHGCVITVNEKEYKALMEAFL